MTETYRIEAIALHEVGVFDDVRIDFPPIESPERDAEKAEIHVFTGPNGCGKSTLLYALGEIFHGTYSIGLIARRLRTEKSRVEFKFSGCVGAYGKHLPFDNTHDFLITPNDPTQYNIFHLSNDYIFGVSKPINFNPEFNYLRIYKEKTTYSDALNQHPINHTSTKKFLYAAFGYSGQRTLNQIRLDAIQEIENSPFESALSFDSTIRPKLLLQWIANNRTKSALAKADGDLPAAQQYDKALERITQAVREICDLDIEFRLERQPLAVTLRVGSDIIQFDTLPDGLKSIISWIGDLSVRLEMIPWVDTTRDIFAQNLILFLDEIDIHLHPKWQRKILPVVQKLFPNSQIFVSTHSPFVVGSVEDAWIYQLPEKNQQTDRIIKPVKSDPGKSYRLILKEIFDIDKDFGEETEALLAKFYHYRGIFLNEQRNKRELLSAARKLAGKGVEVRAIVERELRQLARVTGQALDLA